MYTLRDKILHLLEKPMRFDDLRKKLPEISKSELSAEIGRLTASGEIMKNKKNRLAISSHYGCIVGTYLSTSQRFGFVSNRNAPDDKDIFIPANLTGGAWHGDEVLVRLTEKRKYSGGTDGQEGEVISILSRSNKELVGCLCPKGKTMYFVPDKGKYPDILVPKSQLSGAKAHERVSVQMTFYGDINRPAKAKVTQIFGKNGLMEASIAAILHENGITVPFPEAVISEAKSFGKSLSENAYLGRTDLRNELVFTIDGDDAQDFDDAVSLKTLENGNLELGVHIADVSYYVTEGSALDIEAFDRGTSVYYPGHVVPMLPFELSAGLCSLRPNEDRLAFSAFLEIDKTGKRINSRFCRSVICSKARMTYRKVNRILSGDEEFCKEYDFLVQSIKQMANLADLLNKKRVSRGALELDLPEPEILTDETGEPISLQNRPREKAEHLIEEFMLLANEAVAEYMDKHNYPCVYRVHENPDPQKLRVFANFAKMFGHKIDASKPNDTRQLQKVLEIAADDPKQRALPTLLLRSLARARYSEENLGHYGLQAKYYLHFTSPIRRYPDLVTHRMLARAIKSESFTPADYTYTENAASHSSTREFAADTAERAIDRLYIAAYMEKFVGDDFDAEISGVQSFGVFVTLENGAEGLVRIESLSGYYEYDEEKMQLLGRNGVRLTIGTPMKVKLIRSDRISGQIDFIPSEEKENPCRH